MSGMDCNRDCGEGVSFSQIVILALSIYVLAALAVEWLFELPDQALALMHWMDVLVCGWFLADFCIRFWKAPSKARFMQWGWIDLVSSIPFLPFLRWGRLVRLVRILMILRSIRSFKAMFEMIFKSRIRGTFMSVLLACAMLVMVSSVAILVCETGPRANIKTAGDALWWAFSTVTSVGYGELYPVTLEGRLIAAVLMTAGVALFTTLTAFIVSAFINVKSGERADTRAILDELRELRRKVDSMSGANALDKMHGRDNHA